MKVSVCKTINVDCEVDVDLIDCLNEMLEKASSENASLGQCAIAIDGATKILERITPEAVRQELAKHPKAMAKFPGSLVLIRRRLQAWIDATKEA